MQDGLTNILNNTFNIDNFINEDYKYYSYC